MFDLIYGSRVTHGDAETSPWLPMVCFFLLCTRKEGRKEGRGCPLCADARCARMSGTHHRGNGQTDCAVATGGCQERGPERAASARWAGDCERARPLACGGRTGVKPRRLPGPSWRGRNKPSCSAKTGGRQERGPGEPSARRGRGRWRPRSCPACGKETRTDPVPPHRGDRGNARRGRGGSGTRRERADEVIG